MWKKKIEIVWDDNEEWTEFLTTRTWLSGTRIWDTINNGLNFYVKEENRDCLQ